VDPSTIEKLSVLGVVVLGSGATIRWLLAERKDLISRLEAKSKIERELREQRTQELLQASQLLADTRTVVEKELTDLRRALNDLQKEVARCCGGR
jgi:argininosuccinate lyase